jgi:Uma2 family endonuclease
MQLELPGIGTRAKIDVQGDHPMDDDAFYEFCATNAELRIERDADGEIIIMPPTGFETGYRNTEIIRQLANWALAEGRGYAADSSTVYLLPNGAARSPDASWVFKSRLAELTTRQIKSFLPLCPDFVVELMSSTDRLKKAHAKMHEWMDNGAQLGWLIDSDKQKVWVYRPGKEPEELADVDHVSGEGPVTGFRLETHLIWRGI